MKKQTWLILILSLMFRFSATADTAGGEGVWAADEIQVDGYKVYLFPENYYFHTDSWNCEAPNQFTPNINELSRGLKIVAENWREFWERHFKPSLYQARLTGQLQAFGIDKSKGLLLLVYVPSDCSRDRIAHGIVPTASKSAIGFPPARLALLAVVDLKNEKLVSVCPFIMESDDYNEDDDD